MLSVQAQAAQRPLDLGAQLLEAVATAARFEQLDASLLREHRGPKVEGLSVLIAAELEQLTRLAAERYKRRAAARPQTMRRTKPGRGEATACRDGRHYQTGQSACSGTRTLRRTAASTSVSAAH
jgi:hypothetical protein